MTPEEKARDFLDYIGRHEERLRHNLAKNVDWDRELFENTFQDTVIRIHDAILRNDPDIGNYETYFYKASRKRYQTLTKKRRFRRSKELPLEDNRDEEKKAEEEPASVAELKELIVQQFGSEAAELFLDYMGRKVTGRVSYRDYGLETGIRSITVKDTVTYIREYLRKKYPHGPSSLQLKEDKAALKAARMKIAKLRESFEHGMDREKEKGIRETEPCEG